MINSTLAPVKHDFAEALVNTISGPHGNAAILGCTVCILAGIAGVCYLSSEGHPASFSFLGFKFQMLNCNDEVL